MPDPAPARGHDAVNPRRPRSTHRRRVTSDIQRLRWLAALAIISLALFSGLYLGAVRTATGQRVDDRAIHDRATGRAIQQATDHVLDTVSITSLALGGVALGLIALARRRPRLAVALPLAVLAANAMCQLLKKVLDRPDLHHVGPGIGGASYPSGHAMVAMSLAYGFVLVTRPSMRPWIGVMGSLYAIAIGAATLTAGWHRPSDVIGSYLLATAWAASLAATLVHRRGAGRATSRHLAWTVPLRIGSPQRGHRRGQRSRVRLHRHDCGRRRFGTTAGSRRLRRGIPCRSGRHRRQHVPLRRRTARFPQRRVPRPPEALPDRLSPAAATEPVPRSGREARLCARDQDRARPGAARPPPEPRSGHDHDLAARMS